ncbi:helix-turn-helix domain-containing protein [Micromonospora sp. NPDC049559]|uniref:TetR/AcrR family transcriptional regulator n=1 Tax=Micromonospora sp. NPDC049559 TaxID=3155923 RepID=UPI003416C5AF
MSQQRSPRRAPEPDQRLRDAERSRQQLLAAALDEFAAKGYAGARVQDIADRAGVNKQLIPYYFGGKEGLYRALEQSWLDQEAALGGPDMPFETLVGEYVHATLGDPRLLRLLIWDGLTDRGEDAPPASAAREPGESGTPSEPPDVADLRRRQETGEIAPDLDPALLLLAMTAAIAAPVVLPQVARRMGIDTSAPGFEARYAEQMRRLVRHLAG